MPNHYHFLIEQVKEGGISQFIGQFQNSYTKYFNSKHKRKGGLFLTPFRAKHVETDEQLIHLSRYIHLNPYTSYVIKSIDQLIDYPYSSIQDYFHTTPYYKSITHTGAINSFYQDQETHKEFLLNQAEYQRDLEKIKHLIID